MRACIFILGVTLASIQITSAQNSAVPWSSFAVGAGIARGGNSAMAVSIGPVSASALSGGEFRVHSGFLAGLAAGSGVTSVEENQALPLTFELHQNFPNPFNPSTTIAYDIPELSRVTIRIFNLLGQLVATVVENDQTPGRYRAVWHGLNDAGAQVSTGVYFYRIHAKKLGGDQKEFVQTRKLVFLK